MTEVVATARVALLVLPLCAGAALATDQESLGLASAVVARVEAARGPHTFVLSAQCPPALVSAFIATRPVVTERQLQVLDPPRGSGYFFVASIRVSTTNPEWAWCEGRYAGGPSLQFSLFKDPECGWRAGTAATITSP